MAQLTLDACDERGRPGDWKGRRRLEQDRPAALEWSGTAVRRRERSLLESPNGGDGGPHECRETVARDCRRNRIARPGCAGTSAPSNTAIQKYANQQKIPQLFVGTGATKWGDPKNFPWTMGWQPPYQAESRIYAQYILKNAPDAKVGILYQNDDYGKDYLHGFEAALGDAAKKIIVLKQSYEVTDPSVESQVANLKNSGANVFLDITATKFASQAIKKAHDIGWTPLHFLNSVSNSVSTVIKVAGLDASKGIITTLYLKDPTDPQWQNDPAMKEWRDFMAKYYPEGNKEDLFNIYGPSAAQTLVQVLKQCGNDLSRANVMRQAANLKDLQLPLLLPGIKINTSPTDFYPIEQEQLAKFDGERWALFGEIFDAGRK